MPDRGGGPTGPRISVGRPSRRVRTLLMTLGALAILGIIFVMFAGFWTDWLWYRSVGYSSVFTTRLWTKVGLFFVFGLLMAFAVGFNIWLAHRLRPPLSAMSLEQESLDRYRMNLAPYKKWVLLGIATLVGLIAGASATGQWRTWLLWVNGQSFGEKDPQFHKDISFFAFDLPWYRFLLGFGFAAIVLCTIAAALTHYLYGGLRISSPGARATSAATGHLAVLLGTFVALKAVAYWFDRYSLATKTSGLKTTDGWTGLRYVDANAYLPAKTILFVIAIICAVLFFATLWRRTWQLPLIGLGLMVLSAILIGGLYPAIVQKFQVQPNEQAKETPFIKKNIDATRKAYDIDGSQVTEYSGQAPKDTTNEQLRTAVDSTASVRLLDPSVVSPTYQQQQQVRGYYQFPGTLDVDRYEDEDGNSQDTVVGLREINVNGIPEKGWINSHFRYTHGYGVVAAKGTEVTDDGDPAYTEKNLPPEGELGDYEPRIYYGEQTRDYSIVGGPQDEVDYADDSGEKTYRYKGDSGVDLSNPINRAAYALTFSEPQIMYSGAIGEGSQIIYNRTPKERVEAVAPWLTIDGDPYPAVVDGRITWIVDAYTTSNGYPYSTRTTLGDTTADSLTDDQRSVIAQQNQVNYIRNSVKATVDAYDGSVDLYEWDTEDPVLKTWMKAFPDTVKPRAEISDALMDHLRYPQDLFKVQRELLTQYHVTSPKQFYSGSEQWEIPDDPTTKVESSVPPYYLSMKMPDQDSRSFSLTTTFTPRNRNNLGAYMAVGADARTDDFGQIRILKLPPNSPVPGPKLVQSRFNSNAAIADQINILQRGDSEVIYGNLLTVPLEGGLIYIEPVYVQGTGTGYPLLRKVLVTYGDQTAFEDTLPKALNVVFGVEEATPPEDTGEEPPPEEEPPAGGTLQDAVEDAQQAYEDGQQALQDQDWEAYGKAQDDLEEALQRIEDAEQQAGANGDGAGDGSGDGATDGGGGDGGAGSDAGDAGDGGGGGA
ncbi:UPF0182 family protein [Streptomyces sp. NPDC004134]|uniref:UPF0182 family membrane protein n=1 Tax=Streptomyces sp. NPDC004134 TaxID=3364691 RepID=UPI0036B19DE3